MAGTLTFDLPDMATTLSLAARLSDALQPGDTVLLDGPVGAGKSALARGVIQHRMAAFGVIEDVPSPTFTLVQTYALRDVEIWHADLYRLTSVAEVFELGLEDAFADAICLVEWPDRLGALTPEDALTVTLTPTDDDRRMLSLEWTAPRWNSVVEAVQGVG